MSDKRFDFKKDSKLLAQQVITSVHELSGAGKDELRACFNKTLVGEREEMGFNKAIARDLFRYVNGKEPSPDDMLKMEINARESAKLPHPRWTHSNKSALARQVSQVER